MPNQDKRQDTLKAVLDYFYQDNTKSGSDSRYNLKYHLVWITKYRRSFLVSPSGMVETPRLEAKESFV
jgi:hypothetical protein